MKPTNTNCLEGMACPDCDSEGPFLINAEVTVLVSDDGTEDQGGDYEWNRDAYCQCKECDFADTVDGFTIERLRYAELKGAADAKAKAEED